MAFELKAHDRRPYFVVILKDNYGEPDEAIVDLTTAGSAVFNMRLAAAPFTVKVTRGSATITNATAGEVEYQWGVTDTSAAGDYQAEVEVIWADGKSETFPGGPEGGSYWDVTITEDIA